jgi:phosphatidyl-myo-inositol dimannoside synthase
MPKILLPTIDFPPARGGVARYIGAIQKTYPDQVKILELRKQPRLISLVIRFLWSARDVEAIWTHHVLPLGTAAMFVKVFTKKPYVVFLHGLDFDLARRNLWKRTLTKWVLSRADRIVTNSEALASEVRAFVQLDRTPLVVYPTLEDRFIEAANTPQLARNNFPEKSPLRLLTVARLVERKGHLKVLAALKDIPDATYHIVGDGPYFGVLAQAINDLGLQDRVRISRAIRDEQLPDVYREADVFVMPTTKSDTDREGFGIVYLEAQLFGLPVVASRHPGVDEAVHDGEGGWLVGDTHAELVAALGRLKDPAVRSKFGSRGRFWVEREFNRLQQMSKLRELL